MNLNEVVKALEEKAHDGNTEAMNALMELRRTSNYESLLKKMDDDELAVETEPN